MGTHSPVEETDLEEAMLVIVGNSQGVKGDTLGLGVKEGFPGEEAFKQLTRGQVFPEAGS